MTVEFKSFMRALKTIGVFGNYILACQKYDGCKNVEKIKYMRLSNREMLNASFCWDGSKDGGCFWLDVYEKLDKLKQRL